MVDRLEELFHRGARIPLTRRVIVDEQAFLDIIDQMRIAIPEEIRQAKRITEERERLLNQARAEAERTKAAAQQQAALLLSKEGIIQAAEAKAAEIIADARAHAEQLKIEADNHCIAVLSALENEMKTLLATTRNGIQHLEARTAALRSGSHQSSEKES